MNDMTWTAPDVDRVEPATAGLSEREALQAWLDYHRQTLLWKCQGLTAEQLATASAPPSNLTLLGLVRHLTDVERGWFRRGLGQEKAPPIYYSDDNPEGDVDVTEADAEANFAAYRAEIALADQAAESVPLDSTFPKGDSDVDARWVYLHMIEEYARHNGHADLIRERIDGLVGD